MLTQIVLALLKDDFRVSNGSAPAKEASNLASYSNLKVVCGRLELRPIDVDHLRAFKRRDTSLNISPVFLIVRCHLTAQTVLNAEL